MPGEQESDAPPICRKVEPVSGGKCGLYAPHPKYPHRLLNRRRGEPRVEWDDNYRWFVYGKRRRYDVVRLIDLSSRKHQREAKWVVDGVEQRIREALFATCRLHEVIGTCQPCEDRLKAVLDALAGEAPDARRL